MHLAANDLKGTESPGEPALKLTPDHERLRLEYALLQAQHRLVRQKAERLGEFMCEVGLALRHAPERTVVMPPHEALPPGSGIVLTRHPPTLLAIERLAEQIRAVDARLKAVSQALATECVP